MNYRYIYQGKFLILTFFALILISILYVVINVQLNSAVPAGLTSTLEREVQPKFFGSTVTTPDTNNLNRLIRGQLTEFRLETNQVMIKAWINFPDKSITRNLEILTTKNTHYLCWKPIIQLSDGTGVRVEDTLLTISNTQKLYQQGETTVEPDVAQALVKNSGPISVVVALEKPFSLNEENRAYQVALLECPSP